VAGKRKSKIVCRKRVGYEAYRHEGNRAKDKSVKAITWSTSLVTRYSVLGVWERGRATRKTRGRGK
jgi:hypothetical protein